MANLLEYTLSLKDKISGVLQKVGAENNKLNESWQKVQQNVSKVSAASVKCGNSISGLKKHVEALRTQRDLIPEKNIQTIRRTNDEIRKLEGRIRSMEGAASGGRVKKWFTSLQTAVPAISLLLNPLVLLGAAIYKVSSYLKDSEEAWNTQAEAEAKLGAVMRNTMNARKEDIDSILSLTAAQQALGVIGDEVQIAGAQELSTYLSKRESLEKLIPVMNDMVAQQYGYNASGEQAVGIATMMGKVMDGQVGALSRYGYKFTEAQEKILKYGTESQRAATLAKVVTDAVGGVNAALAATPEGKLKQHANEMGDLQERIGRLYVQVQASLLPIFEWFRGMLSDVIDWLESNRDAILTIINTIAKVFKTAFTIVLFPIKLVVEALGWWKEKLEEGQPVVVILTGLVSAFGLALVAMEAPMMAMAVWSGIVTAAKWLWTAAQWALNAAMYANPIVWIITLIIGLIGVITYVCYKIDGWRSLWEGVVGFMKHVFLGYVESVKLYWDTMINGILIGIDKIKLGWYKFKEECGIGNSDENQRAIAEINKSVEDRQNAILDGAKKVLHHANKAKESLSGIDMSWTSERSLSDLTSSMKAKLGIETPSIPGMNPAHSGTGSEGDNTLSSGAVNSIATGGSKSTTINITLGNLVENLIFEGGYEGSRDEMMRDLESQLIRVLQMAKSVQ
ncbi:MAG: hypothetical protein LUE98_07770 [Tannerellaceae bacterium]|nr:hypothetical protein [Tannerellaceae bacterium]